MSILLTVLAFVGAIALVVARGLAVDEIKGRIQRRITTHLDATIAALPDELQAEWAEEWRADLAMNISMPVAAAQFVRGVRRSARELVHEPALVRPGLGNHPPTPSSRGVGWGAVLPKGQLHRRFCLCAAVYVALIISAVAVRTVAETLATVLIGLAMLTAVVAGITFIRIMLDEPGWVARRPD
jgi:hypothetical protein